MVNTRRTVDRSRSSRLGVIGLSLVLLVLLACGIAALVSRRPWPWHRARAERFEEGAEGGEGAGEEDDLGGDDTTRVEEMGDKRAAEPAAAVLPQVVQVPEVPEEVLHVAKSVGTAEGYSVEVVDTRDVTRGRCLKLDGVVQVCEHSERKRHEALVHVGASWLSGGAPTRVLIVGGADCMLLREVLKYQGTLERVVIVDDDERIRTACEDHMFVQSHRGDSRVSWVIDSERGMANALRAGVRPPSAFDLVIVDLKRRPGIEAMAPDLYREARLRLASDGVLVACGVGAHQAVLSGIFLTTRTFRTDAENLDGGGADATNAYVCAIFDLGKRKVDENARHRHAVATHHFRSPTAHLLLPSRMLSSSGAQR